MQFSLYIHAREIRCAVVYVCVCRSLILTVKPVMVVGFVVSAFDTMYVHLVLDPHISRQSCPATGTFAGLHGEFGKLFVVPLLVSSVNNTS